MEFGGCQSSLSVIRALAAHGGARSGVSLASVPLTARLSPRQHPLKKSRPSSKGKKLCGTWRVSKQKRD